MPNDSLPEPLRSGGGSGLHGSSAVQLYYFLKSLHQAISSLDISQLQQDIQDLQDSISDISDDIENLQDQIDAIGEYSIPFQGQVAVPSTSTVNILTQSTWTSTGIVGDFDEDIDYGVSIGTSDTFALKNTSGVERIGYFSATINLDPAVGNNKELGVALALDGVVHTPSIQKLFCKSGDEKVSITTSHILRVPNNSEVSVVVANFTSDVDIEIHGGFLSCVRA